MGTWGTGLLDNDHALDWYVDFIQPYGKEEEKVVFTKSQFKKAFSKLLKSCKHTEKHKYDNVCTFETQSWDRDGSSDKALKKLNGQWYHEQLLALYVFGRRCGYEFSDAFLELIRSASYFRMSYSSRFYSVESAMETVEDAQAILTSFQTKGKRNLYKLLNKA